MACQLSCSASGQWLGGKRGVYSRVCPDQRSTLATMLAVRGSCQLLVDYKTCVAASTPMKTVEGCTKFAWDKQQSGKQASCDPEDEHACG